MIRVFTILLVGVGGCSFKLDGLEPIDWGLPPEGDLAMAMDLAAGPDLVPPPDLVSPLDLLNVGPSGDVAEDVVATWDVGESVSDAIEPCAPMPRGMAMLAGETKMIVAGKQAVRVDYVNSGHYYYQAVYPKGGNAGWNLAGRTGVAFQLASGVPMNYVGYDYPGPTIVLCGANGTWRRIDPMVDQLTKALGPYVAQMAPLAGGNGWMIQDGGADGGVFSLTNVSSIEFHVDPNRNNGTGDCVLYLDDVKFY